MLLITYGFKMERLKVNGNNLSGIRKHEVNNKER